MIKKLVKGYNDAKLSAINKFSGIEENSLVDEFFFLDDGYIRARIENLKKQYTSIIKEIENTIEYDGCDDEYKRNKLSEKVNLKDSILFELAFLSSNDFSQLDISKNVLEEMDSDFRLCIEGLIYYKQGNYTQAFRDLNNYFNKNENMFIRHYLVNKVYSELLIMCKEYELATIYLRRVITLKPEVVDNHKILYELYVKLGKLKEAEIENKTICILEG